MQKHNSLENINGDGVDSNAKQSTPDYIVVCKRKHKSVKKLHERFHITVKPKLYRSNSFSDLTTERSDLTADYFKHSSQAIANRYTQNLFYDRSGDTKDNLDTDITIHQYMSWNLKGKKSRKKQGDMSPESVNAKFQTNEYLHNSQRAHYDPNSSCAENSSICSVDQVSLLQQKGATFPFKSTPSGNLKVQSNQGYNKGFSNPPARYPTIISQVVFQSSTVGVLLADPTQAKVKVKIEGNTSRDTGTEDELIQNLQVTARTMESQLIYGARQTTQEVFHIKNSIDRPEPVTERTDRTPKPRLAGVREDKGKDLMSLGYAVKDPVDWLRVQLPKKRDLLQEFYRRIHAYMNTDTVIHISEVEFHCHHIILEIYSAYFEMNKQRELELPADSVSPEAFQMIYEWMIFTGPESNKALKRENILDLFCAAQFLSIKDLEDQCWSFIVNDNLFTEDTAFVLYREARAKGLTPVVELMVPRVMRFFLPLVASKNFLELDSEEVMTFLKSNYICVTSEIEVLMAGVRWLYGDWPNRRRHAVEVMKCVRFGLISPWQLVDIKRNPDNAEILEIVNDPAVQQMVDDGLAYVIIKYWYGNNSKNYYHWIDVLGLTEPAERNWIGEEKNHVTYKDFLKYLEQFMVPKDQMYQQMAMLQTTRRNDDNVPGCLRGDEKMEIRRPKLDFPLPSTLKAFTSGDKEKGMPTMSEFFESRRKAREASQSPSPARSPPLIEGDTLHTMQQFLVDRQNNQQRMQQRPSPPPAKTSPTDSETMHLIQQRVQQEQQLQQQRRDTVEIQKQRKSNAPVNNGEDGPCQARNEPFYEATQIYEPPVRDSAEDSVTANSETSTTDTSLAGKDYMAHHGEKRHSVAACYLAAATAALSSTRRDSANNQPAMKPPPSSQPPIRPEMGPSLPSPPKHNMSNPNVASNESPRLSMFRQSKESLARINMNKLSTSILGPSNRNYIAEGSLFNWDRETVLVFGGIDPHTTYGVGRNTGKDIFRFDPVMNFWDYVGELPEPRHHHSVAFLRGRVFLVGGADPRDDDIRGKSVVVSTVWSYEPVTRSWWSENGLSVPRKNFGLVVHRSCLYAIGGQDKKGRVLRSVEKFDPKTGAWTEARSMSVARMAVAATKYREYIWVAGGMTGEKKRPLCKIVECYNSKTDEWTEIHNLRFPRCFATLFSMNDKLYLVGGAGRLSDKDKSASSVGAIDVWDWKERAWKQTTELSIPRHGHALAYLGTQLIIIGGVTTIYMRALNNVESFCCERGAWIRGVAALPSPLSGHGAVTLPPASLM